MSRIRTVKPEFWSSDQVTSLTINARLLFLGMLNFCDDGGIHPNSSRTLKAEVFPMDANILPGAVESMVNELLDQNLVVTYEVNWKAYLRVTGWGKHQKIDRPTFKHPWPCGTVPADKEHFIKLFDEYSTSIHPRKGV